MRIHHCLIAAAMLFSSCATIFSGSRKIFSVDSTPQSAKVEIIDRYDKVVYRGQTPVTTRLKTGAGFFKPAIYEIKVTMDGYQTKSIPVQARINGWYFGNILIGGVIGMLIVDPATGAMYKFSDTQSMIDATLVPNTTGSTSTTPAAAQGLKIVDLRDVPVDQRAGLVRLPG